MRRSIRPHTRPETAHPVCQPGWGQSQLLAHLDALADRLGSNRQELVHLAATRILRFHHNIENRMLDEMFRAPNNRKHLLAKHARRERIRRRGRGSGT